MENYDVETDNGGVLKKQLDADELINSLVMNLKGDYLDPYSGEYVKNKFKSYMNDEGIIMVASMLKARISNNFQYSTLNKEQIVAIRLICIRDLWQHLVYNLDEYKVQITDVSIILNMVDDALLLFLSRTESGGFKKFISNLFKGSESYTERSEPEPTARKGIFG